jgi:hypothetical protein
MKYKAYKIILLLLTIAIFSACSESKTPKYDDKNNRQKELTNDKSAIKEDTSLNTKKTKQNESSWRVVSNLYFSKDSANNRARLKLIRNTIDSFGFLELPYRYYYNSDSLGGISDKFDKNAFHKAGIAYSGFIGILPDTTVNFYYIQALAASVMYLEIFSINKKGEKVFHKERSLLSCDCLHYVEDDIYCTEYIIIKDSLKLEHYYKTKYIYNVLNENDTVCEFKQEFGYINTNNYGQVIYDSIIKKNCPDEK